MPISEPPSRDSNPFATCWTRPGALPYVSHTKSCDAGRVIQQLNSSGWRGQLVGPHGSGKSTLLRTLAQHLPLQGITPRPVEALDQSGIEIDSAGEDELLMIEGFERLGWSRRTGLLSRLKKSRVGFVLTTHRPLHGWRAPAVVARLNTDEAVLTELYGCLVATRPSAVTLEDARRSHCRRRGNLRAVWFDLYNLHETLRRTERTAPVAASYGLSAVAS